MLATRLNNLYNWVSTGKQDVCFLYSFGSFLNGIDDEKGFLFFFIYLFNVIIIITLCLFQIKERLE